MNSDLGGTDAYRRLSDALIAVVRLPAAGAITRTLRQARDGAMMYSRGGLLDWCGRTPAAPDRRRQSDLRECRANRSGNVGARRGSEREETIERDTTSKEKRSVSEG